MLQALAIIAVVAAVVLFARKLDVHALQSAFRNAKPWPLILAGALSFVQLGFKALGWRELLAPIVGLSPARAFRYTAAGAGMSILTPARAGEGLRVWLLKRDYGVMMTSSSSVAVAEKLVDGIAMLIVLAPLPWLLPELPSWIGRGIVGFSLVLGGALVVLWFLAPVEPVAPLAQDACVTTIPPVTPNAPITANEPVTRISPVTPISHATPIPPVMPTASAGHKWWHGLQSGLSFMRRPRHAGRALLAMVCSWLTDWVEVTLVLYAVGVHVPLAAGLLILLTINMAIAVPAVPGSLGTMEIGALVALELLHVPREQGVLFALLYHAVQVVPLLVLSVVGNRWLLGPLKRSNDRHPDRLSAL